MTNEADAIVALTHEMALTRTEMAALTDALTANRHVMESLRDETVRLADLMETALSRRGFWSRLLG
jgi:hypothetical protein